MSLLKRVPVYLIMSLILLGLGQSVALHTTEASERQKVKRIQNGVWGGNHIRLEVNDNGAEIEYDCGRGTIDQAFVTDSAGHFNLTGKRLLRRPGAVLLHGQATLTRPTRYSGQINGQTMTLTVTFTDNSETLGTYTLTRGNEGHLWKCR